MISNMCIKFKVIVNINFVCLKWYLCRIFNDNEMIIMKIYNYYLYLYIVVVVF